MPVMKIKGGYRWGHHGKVYRGIKAKEKATKQGRAVHVSMGRIMKRRSLID